MCGPLITWRLVRFWLLRLGLIPFLLLCTLGFAWGDELAHREQYLRFVREDVTPGRISAPVVPLSYAPARSRGSERVWGLGILTEDRYLRVLNHQGDVMHAVRTGLRSAVAAGQDRTGRVFLAGPDGVVYRTSLERKNFTVLISPGRLTPEKLWMDREGNLFLLSTAGEILHISAAGTLLWRRALPAPVRSTAHTENTLFLSTEDGRIFAFDSTGYGQVLYRRDNPFVEMYPTIADRMLFLIGRDSAGVIAALEVSGSGGRMRWENADNRHTTLLGTDGGGNSWIIGEDSALRILDRHGVELSSLRLPGLSAELASLDRKRRRLYAVDSDNRLLTILEDGFIGSALQLNGTPRIVDFVPATEEVLARYEDWRLAVFSTVSPETRPVISPGGDEFPRLSMSGGESGALTVLADTVLAGSSRSERVRLLDTISSRIDGGRLFGQVEEVRSILIRLLQERGGVHHTGFPDLRRRTVSLLSLFLDVSSREALSAAVRSDSDTSVVVAALHGLAESGLGDTVALESAHQRWVRSERSEQALLAEGILRLLEGLLGEHGHFGHSHGPVITRVSAELASHSAVQSQRERAAAVLRELQ